MDAFEIKMTPWNSSQSVTFRVTLIYESNQVERYQLKGGKKEVVFEKRLLQKSQKWKVLRTNFQFETVDEGTVRDMHRIWDMIDEWRTGKYKNMPTYRPPDQRRSNK